MFGIKTGVHYSKKNYQNMTQKSEWTYCMLMEPILCFNPLCWCVFVCIAQTLPKPKQSKSKGLENPIKPIPHNLYSQFIEPEPEQQQKTQSKPSKTQSKKHKTQNTKHKTQNTKHKIQNTKYKYKTPSTTRKPKDTKNNTKHKTQNTKNTKNIFCT